MSKQQFYFGVVSGGSVAGIGGAGIWAGLTSPSLAIAGLVVLLANVAWRLNALRNKTQPVGEC